MISKTTLSQRISLLFSALIIVLLVGNAVLNVTTKRSYVESQLGSLAQDAATSIGLTLSSSLGEGDLVLASSYVDSFFDSGDYRSITIHDQNNKLIFERNASGDIEGVPNWFVSLITLSTAHAESTIQRGWSELGRVSLLVHPGYAYRLLWDEMRFQVLWAILLIALAYLIVRRSMSVILKPLREIELHALSLTQDQQFGHKLPEPRVRELASVTHALNDMSVRLGAIFQDQLRQIENMRLEKQMDPLTTCWNREAFDHRMESLFDMHGSSLQGTIFLLQLNHLEKINQRLGRQATDELLQDVAAYIKRQVAPFSDALCSRRAGGDFAFFVPALIEDQADDLAQDLLNELADISAIKRLLDDNLLHIGLTGVRGSDQLSGLLSRADLALGQAQSKLRNAWHRYRDEGEIDGHREVREAGQWLHVLQQVIKNRRFSCLSQPILDAKSEQVVAHQVYSRIDLDGELIEASKFLPMARRYNLLAEVDRIMIENALTQIAKKDHTEPFILTIADLSLRGEHFGSWLVNQIVLSKINPSDLVIEISEYALKQDSLVFQTFCALLTELGCKLCVSQFGQSGLSLSYLTDINVDWVKTEQWSIRNIQLNEDNKLLLQSAIQLTRSRSIGLIANGVETEDEMSTLCDLGVRYVMGYHLAHPGPM